MTQSRPLLRTSLFLALAAPLLLGIAASCSPVRYIMMTASPTGAGPDAEPSLPGLENGLDGWIQARPEVQALLSETLYGAPLPVGVVEVTSRALIDDAAYNGAGRLEMLTLLISLPDDGQGVIDLALVTPNGSSSAAPAILIPSDCGLQAQLLRTDISLNRNPVPSYCEPTGSMLEEYASSFFGEYVVSPPIEQILRRGYAVAAWHESDIAPDRASLHGETLSALGLDPDAPDRPGVIGVWAWMMSRVADALETDPQIDASRLAVMGHSRRAKAALLAGARDERIGVVLAHQSGTGGASLHRDNLGEPIGSITDSYPHWFAPGYAAYAEHEDELPLDAHYLLALIAPRSVLLGNSWRDVWSDPAGAWRAAEAASPVWSLYGVDGLNQTRLDQMDASGRLAYHIRPATHGVRAEDWNAFLDFLDARLEP
ncbi:hypothetical protein ACFELO_06360 [Oceanicaulis sp. LC35]|uniref:glucuronyl esterase domain-containing protein n=1 Tax=Oceanicaulis sp. LC35 TaxID=3349635 RepID=UPI003F83B664